MTNDKVSSKKHKFNGYQDEVSRWSRFGPYYAMFPVRFVSKVIATYSSDGDAVIDPFAGRGTTTFVGGVLNRIATGIEINPVGWIYGQVKLNPASLNDVISKLRDIYAKKANYTENIRLLPEFFSFCFCNEVLEFLLSARDNLDWKNNNIDRTLMALLLVSLHGKLGEGLSNQMRQTKSMYPNYSIKWWRENNMLTPPAINPYDFMLKKLEWRYLKGTPSLKKCKSFLGDSTEILPELVNKRQRYSLLLTSPPYYQLTDYHNDQWLRLWLLGGADKPVARNDDNKKRFSSKEKYFQLLLDVFSHSAKLMKRNSTIYVRTDAREFTFNTTLEVLTQCFPKHQVKVDNRPYSSKTKTQTALFGDKSKKPGERDILLHK